MGLTTKRLLIITANQDLAKTLSRTLRSSFTIDFALKAESALKKVRDGRYDSVIIDSSTTDMPAIVFCQKFREFDQITPLVALTEDSKVTHKISLFNAGADDCIIKPFNLDEMQARLQACLRRNPHVHQETLVVGDTILDTDQQHVERQGLRISLRHKEFLILECLMLHSGTVVSRQQLIDYAWDADQSVWANSIDVHIKYIRDKIDRPFATAVIHTVRSAGYVFRAING